MLEVMTRKPDHRGVTARTAILRELRRREDAGLPAPTMRQLAAVTGASHASAILHVRTLAAAGLVEQRGELRHRRPYLTPAGRIATD